MSSARKLIVAALFVAGCASHAVRPDDESAEAHRAEAARARAEAAKHTQQYDPKAVAEESTSAGRRFDLPDDVRTYNPTAWHLREAHKDSAHAKAHEAAAAQLEAFEAEECRAFAPKVRSACPVGGPVARVEDLRNGVRLVLADNAPVGAVLAHMRCHLAWARTRGFEKLPGCPVYVKGIDIHASSDGKSIEITSTDSSVVHLIQQRSHEENATTA